MVMGISVVKIYQFKIDYLIKYYITYILYAKSNARGSWESIRRNTKVT